MGATFMWRSSAAAAAKLNERRKEGRMDGRRSRTNPQAKHSTIKPARTRVKVAFESLPRRSDEVLRMKVSGCYALKFDNAFGD
jgi:hypothetical protein